MRFSFYMLACVIVAPVGPANAQEFPQRVEQPVSDPYGVEVKSARFGDLSIPLISIGGEGNQALKRVYAPQDGRELLVQAIYDMHTSQEIFSNINVYEVIRYQTPNGTTKFRRSGSSAPFEAEHASEGTLLGGVFTDKFGVKYSDGKMTYPDGREIWGGTSSIGVSPSFHAVSVVRNNFGFLLKTNGGITQAVNLARDYCDFNAQSLCPTLSAVRTASSAGSSAQHYVLTNAAGEAVDVQLQPIEAYVGEPRCQTTGTTYFCTGWQYPYNYPTLITFPGSNKPPITISYRKSGDQRNVSHSEVVVDQISRNGITVIYDNANYPYGAGGNGPTGYQVIVKAYVNGARQFSANATNIGRPWPPSSLDLKNVEDGLGHLRYFFYDNDGNIVKEIQPEGGGVSYEYDARFNITKVTNDPKPGSNSVPLVTGYEYAASCTSETQATCNLPTAMIDPKGYRTEYTYNVRGQLLTKSSPAPSPGAARPVVRNTYTMRTAFILDASGNAVAAGSPISLLTMTSSCLTTENCVGSTDEVKAEFDYGPLTGPNNLLLRGVTVTAKNGSGQLETLRTCYGYNYFGERISETKPRAALTNCP